MSARDGARAPLGLIRLRAGAEKDIGPDRPMIGGHGVVRDAGIEHLQVLHVDRIERHTDEEPPVRPRGFGERRDESGLAQPTVQGAPIPSGERVQIAEQEAARCGVLQRALESGFDLFDLQLNGHKSLHMQVVDAEVHCADLDRRSQRDARQIVGATLLGEHEALDLQKGIAAEERQADLAPPFALAGEIDVVEPEALGQEAGVAELTFAHDFLKRDHVGARQLRVRAEEFEHALESLAEMDVVAHDSNRRGRLVAALAAE